MRTDCQPRGRAPRGAAALEFALSLPLMLLFIGGMLTFFSVVHARAQLVDIVGNVTRGCGMLAAAVTDSNVDDCAQKLGTMLTTSGGVHANACFGSPVTFSHAVTASGRPPTAIGGPTMSTLVVTARCDTWSFTPLYAFGHEGEAPAPTSFSATAAVAFLSKK